MTSVCTIELLSQEPFYPGATITGNVICVFYVKESILGITCTLYGRELTDIVYRNETGNYNLIGINVFLSHEIVFRESGTIEAGTYKFPFSFQLNSSGIPSSFKNEFAEVKYNIQAQVNKSLGRSEESEITVRVNTFIDLNDLIDEIIMSPVKQESEVMSLGGCCSVARVSLALQLEKDAFVLGEVIKVFVEVNNVGQEDTVSTAIELIKHTEYTTTGPPGRTHLVKEPLSHITLRGARAGTKMTDTCELPLTKNIDILCLTNCKLIKQWFTITGQVLIGVCFDEFSVSVDIKLGHVAVLDSRLAGSPKVPVSKEQIGFKMEYSKEIAPVPMNIIEPRRDGEPPYPVGPSYFPLPPLHQPNRSNRAVNLPGFPAVHVSSRDSNDEGTAPSAPLLESAGSSFTMAPPSYDEALKDPTVPNTTNTR